MAEQNRIQAKIGDSEFLAEGPDAVESYQKWLEVLRLSLTTSSLAHAPRPETPPPPPTNKKEAHKPAPANADLERAFKVDSKAKMVTLNALPARGDTFEADALLLVLYGFHACLGIDSVLSGTLMKAAEQSGAKVARADRAINHHRAFIVVSGQRRGRRYGLNNPGIQGAEKLLQGLFG